MTQKRKTQKQRLKDILDDGLPHCSDEFLEEKLSEYRSIINQIRKDGCVVTTEKCKGRCGRIHTSNRLQLWQLQSFNKGPYTASEMIEESRRAVEAKRVKQPTLL